MRPRRLVALPAAYSNGGDPGGSPPCRGVLPQGLIAADQAGSVSAS